MNDYFFSECQLSSLLYSGKTESTKLIVSHIIHCSGDADDPELQNRILEVRIENI